MPMAAQSQGVQPFDSLVNAVTRQCTCVIFYDKKVTDTIQNIPSVNNLEQFLTLTTQVYGFTYVRDNRGNVYLIKGNAPVVKLPATYFLPARQATPSDKIEENLNQTVINPDEVNKVYTIGNKRNQGGNAVLSGYVRDFNNGEPIIASSVMIEGSGIGVSTDAFGFYSISLPVGRHVLRVSSIGMKEVIRQLQVQGSGKMDIELKEEVRSLKTAVVVAQKQSNVRGMQMGVERLSIKAIKQIPAVFGETDILKSLLTLPGITSVGEGTVGYNVRGGAADQNLVLVNDMTIYNPTHLFGFFSAVDPDVVRGLELYKSAIPEKYGGRLSSIMEVTTRDGNAKKLSGTLGLGPLTSKFSLEGPLGSEKTTFITGGRITYSNWLIREIPDPSFNRSKASFYDLILHLSHTFSEKDRIYFSAYVSNDQFRLNQDSTYGYGNRNIRVKWKHDFSTVFYHVLSAGVDEYSYFVNGRNNPKDAFDLGFGIRQYGIRSDFKYSPSNIHEVNFGLQHQIYRLDPGSQRPADASSLIAEKIVQKELGTESALYVGDQYRITDQLSIQAGLRYAFYRYVGPRRMYTYADGLPPSASTVKDSTDYAKGDLITSYHGPEVRFSARWMLSNNTSLKFSFNTVRQFIHMITNTAALSPTDIWKLSDPLIKPQYGQQAAIGFYTQPGTKGVEISVEAYYKNSVNYLDYKSGAQLVLNQQLERDVIGTKGKIYGIELLFKKTAGKLSGWLGYTYLRTLLKVNDAQAGELINQGKFYPANFDKPHIVNLVANYKFTQRYSISLTSTYSTGRPITLPIATYMMAGAPRVFYSERNAFRIPDFFRTDLSMVIENSHNNKKKVLSSWIFGVYNLTGRDNPYSVYFTLENGQVKGYQLSVFATALPFVSFNLKF
jgi:hypothetical protein